MNDSDRDALEGFAYEATMANYTPRLVVEAEIQKSAYLESFLVHVRNLMEFFKHQPAGSDVLWAGKFTKRDWPTRAAKQIWDHINLPTPESQPIMQRISTRLSHLGKDRRKYDHEWNAPAINSEVQQLARIFLDELKDEYRKELERLRGAPDGNPAASNKSP